MTPRGKFTLDESSVRPVVLLSAGVGITPMISMLEQLVANSEKCGCERPVWFIHGARTGAEHAFAARAETLPNGARRSVRISGTVGQRRARSRACTSTARGMSTSIC